MRKLQGKELMEFVVGPIKLACPCGEPLSICKLADGRWMVGHLEKMCSVMTHCETVEGMPATDRLALGSVMQTLVRSMIDGSFLPPDPPAFTLAGIPEAEAM